MAFNNDTTVPVSKVRNLIRSIATDGNFLKNEGSVWRFNANTPFSGLDTSSTYRSQDEAVDAILGVYFPELRKMAA